MINAVYILKYKNSDDDSMLEVLKLVASRTQFFPGCHQSTVWKNDERSEFMLYEIWRSKEDFDRHINTPMYKRLLAAMEMSAENPVVKISEFEDARGIDRIEEIIENNKK